MPPAYTLNPEQTQAFKAIKKFLAHPAADTFVLKGYAGTGKTFLMQHVAQWLKAEEKQFCLLAATGRASTVLRGKTGFEACTVHSELYSFNGVQGFDEEHYTGIAAVNRNGQMSMQFTTRMPDELPMLYIVDEASMLSGEPSAEKSFMSFGSGILLDDFFEVIGKNKVIFVGDPCQLPPVGQAFSPALDVNWLTKRQRTAVAFTLQKIERTHSTNDILLLAAHIREMSQQESFESFPRLAAANLTNVKLHSSDELLFQSYMERFRARGTNGTLAIARSNKMVQHINRAVRRELFGSSHVPLQPGDVLLVTQNNYSVPLSNGDFVEVIELQEQKQQASLNFQRIRVKAIATDVHYSILLSLDALNSLKGSFSHDQLTMLMIDFTNRMRKKEISPGNPAYKQKMLTDEYLNCLKATYGYAVTCHKAQGGEWDAIYLFLNKSMYGMPRKELCQWWYTSVTRARQELHLLKEWWIK